jgi:hypothetical protein
MLLLPHFDMHKIPPLPPKCMNDFSPLITTKDDQRGSRTQQIKSSLVAASVFLGDHAPFEASPPLLSTLLRKEDPESLELHSEHGKPSS